MTKTTKHSLLALLVGLMLLVAVLPAQAATLSLARLEQNYSAAPASPVLVENSNIDMVSLIRQASDWEEIGYPLPASYPLINTAGQIRLASNPSDKPLYFNMVEADSECIMLEPYADALWHKVMINGQEGYISTSYLDASEFSADYKFSRQQDMRIRTGYTAEQLEVYLKDGMSGLGEAYADAEATYGVNSLFLIAICQIESVNGTSGLARNRNNLAGIGGPGGWRSFESYEDCVYYLAEMLSSRYLSPEGSLYRGSTISGVSSYYCGGSGTWITNVGNSMERCWKAIQEAEAKAAEAEAMTQVSE